MTQSVGSRCPRCLERSQSARGQDSNLQRLAPQKAGGSSPSEPALRCLETTQGWLVATATHTGPIAKIGDAHQAVCEWSKAAGYRLAGPRWEIYGDPDPSSGDFDVQVFWSLVAP